MPRDTVPCICCGCVLQNIFDDSENQPNDGLAFMSSGHYGSTAFDPMDGGYLEINICDACIQQAQLLDQIFYGKSHKPRLQDGVLVGMTETKNRPLISWNGDGSGDFKIDIDVV